MSLGLRAVYGAAMFCVLAAPALALETDRATVSPPAQRALALAALPVMSAVRTFTVIPSSTAPADLKTLETYFAGYGFGVKETPRLKNLILTGTLAAAGNSAHASFSAVRVNGETIVRATPFAFPAAIARLIRATSFVPGAHARPLSVRPALVANGPANGYGPADVASLYDIAPVYAAGNTGVGQTIAVAACSSVSVADLTHYDELFGLPRMQYTVIPVDGTSTQEDGEATLDVERVHGTAPGAAVRLYLSPDCTFSEIVDMFAQIAEDDGKYHFAAVTHSYGFNEGDYAADGLAQSLLDESAALAELAGEGTAVFVASGDGGSWNDLGVENATDVSFPASDSSVISVGGTTIEESAVGTRLFEHGWTGSGGGVSDIFTIPAYQAATAGVASGMYKNLPDVAMIADPYTGVTEVFAVGGGTFPIGGTSVAAPTFAGVWTLVQSARAAAGTTPLANAGAALYANRSTFTDVTAGTNGFYVAKPGYDNVTGLGTPDAEKLVTALK
jgi:kumamolisin